MRRRATKASAGQVQTAAEMIRNDGVHFANGAVTSVVIDGVDVPCIIRDGKPYGPVRILEQKLLHPLSKTAAVNAAFRERLLISKFLTYHEAIRLTHTASQQYIPFTDNDLVVNMEEFSELYTHVKSTLQKKSTVVGGWIQVNNRLA